MLSGKKDVDQAFDQLILCVSKCVQEQYDIIKKLAGVQDSTKIATSLQLAEKLEKIKSQITNSRNEWNGLFYSNESLQVTPVSEETKNTVADRTSWKKANDSIRVETQREDGPAYSNTFPLSLFKDMARAAFDFIEQNGYVKTSDVFISMKNKIIAESDYKRAPRIPVYATFKVLASEQLIKVDENNSHKYIRVASQKNFNEWISNL